MLEHPRSAALFPRLLNLFTGIESESLHHISPSTEKFSVQLPDCFWVFYTCLRSPRPSLDVAPLFKGKDKPSISNDNLTRIKTLEDTTLGSHVEYLDVFYSQLHEVTLLFFPGLEWLPH